MKRYSPRTLTHSRHGHGVDSILFPWLSARSARHGVLPQRVAHGAATPNTLSDRAWVWVGVGVLTSVALGTAVLYGWLISLVA